MRSIRIILLSGLLFLGAVSPALAAPAASVSLDRARHYVYLTFAGLSGVSRVSYTLVYDSRYGQKGFEGGFRNGLRGVRSSRKQILGTCSSGRCVYHQNVRNVQLETTFFLRNGGSTRTTRTLP